MKERKCRFDGTSAFERKKMKVSGKSSSRAGLSLSFKNLILLSYVFQV